MMRPFEIVSVGVASVTLLLYAGAETFGWAAGGTRRPPIPVEQLRQTSPGSWTYVYWHHGYRGK